jgi:protein dithiol:quinone oxidoreductase
MHITMITSPRLVFILTAVICMGLLGYGYYLQFVDGLEPCPMCIFQRLCYIAIAVVTLIGAVHGPRHSAVYVYGVLAGVIALLGAAIAGRQVWLQHLPPDRVPECGPGLDFMLEMYPLVDAVEMMLRGTGECAQVDWTFLGFSIAEWSLVCFALIFAAYTAFMFVRIRGTDSPRAI